MGLDYSSHPVDPDLFRSRLIPYAMGEGDISDLLDRAVDLAEVLHRASVWALATTRLSSAMREAQEAVAPIVTHHYKTPGKQSLLGTLLGRASPMVEETYQTPAYSPGIPGFDSDLHVWGRPFFITSQTPAEALAAYQSFLDGAGHPPPKIDELCAAMLADLDARRSQPLEKLDTAVAEAVGKAPPYLSALEVDAEATAFDRARARKRGVAHWNAIRAIWDRRTATAPFDLDLLEQEARVAAGLPPQEEDSRWIEVSDPNVERHSLVKASDALAGLPFRIMQFAAELQPGWMGKGRAHASSIVRHVNINSGDLFEKPTPLFEEMIAAARATGRDLHRNLADNFSLGAYVPPEKVPRLVELLETNEHRLIRAWVADESNPFQMESGLTCHLKNLEPAKYAASKGWGYLEAAEIYSGFLGMTN